MKMYLMMLIATGLQLNAQGASLGVPDRNRHEICETSAMNPDECVKHYEELRPSCGEGSHNPICWDPQYEAVAFKVTDKFEENVEIGCSNPKDHMCPRYIRTEYCTIERVKTTKSNPIVFICTGKGLEVGSLIWL